MNNLIEKLAGWGFINGEQLPHWADALTAMLSVFTLGAIILGAIQIGHVSQQMHRELENQYLIRFWQLMDRRSDSMRMGGELANSDKVLLLDYFSLSEDQIALRGLGRVTKGTWMFWREDIKNFCSKAEINNVLMKHIDNFPHLKLLMENKKYDPLRFRRIKELHASIKKLTTRNEGNQPG